MMSKANQLTNLSLAKLSLFINQRYGLDFRQQRIELLQEAVQKRIQACKASDISEYLDLMQQREDEVLLLINLLTVNETYFFREPPHLDILTNEIIPWLVKNGGHYPVLRLLSAGCSTGEEAYSMAIAALKVPGVGIDWDFEVIGIDVDKEAIKKAQTGIYGLYSFRSCLQNIQDSYFEQVSKESFRIKSAVKEKVRFEPLNLFEQEYPAWLQKTDIIFYRNVSIYFSKEQREEVFRRLAGLLNNGGCLFLSCTETLYHKNRLMSLQRSGEAFYYQKQDAAFGNNLRSVATVASIDKQAVAISSARQKFVSPIRKPPPKAIPPKGSCSLSRSKPKPSLINKGDKCRRIFADALELVKIKKYDDAIACLDEILAVDSFFVKAYTLKANILLNRQSVDAAIAACQAALVVDTFCLEAYLLLGMAAKFAGQMEESIQRFKEAVYVYPEGWLAHFFLAQVYQVREERSYAKREYEVALRILKQGNFENHGLSFFSVPFQLDDFIQLCQHNIAKLAD